MELEKISEKITYSDEKFTKKILFKENNILSFILNFKPGQGVPPHNHEKSDLIIQVLIGQGEMGVDGKNHKILQGDIIHCKGNEVFSLSNTGYVDMSCLVMLAPNPSPVYSEEV